MAEREGVRSRQDGAYTARVLRYDWARMRFEEVEATASELRRCFDTYLKQTR